MYAFRYGALPHQRCALIIPYDVLDSAGKKLPGRQDIHADVTLT